MLDSHKDIDNPGEVDFAFDYLTKSPDTNNWTFDADRLRADKIMQLYNLEIPVTRDGQELAHNFVSQFSQRTQGNLVLNIHRNVEKVAEIFPNSRIIHLIRDPRDVAQSCIGMGWAGTAYFGVNQWIEAETSWENFGSLFNNKNILELFFEDLIFCPTEELTKVCKFLGVSFSPDMLSYSSRSTYEAPNISAIQRWKKTLAARDVALVEIRAGRLLTDRHYELSGYPLDPPGWGERARLMWINKTSLWKFGCTRYGYLNFLMEKLTRRISARLHFVFLRRINEIANQHLK
jgi:hypothetical protein